ncbi:asparagine synthase (glutamine-hydrolyzing) [Cryobacterium roopkundense]|uniref:asparagine synthase (glutamine-hydrolyzing) n=1 Tax=Cryobacterium roopkundense TaxID=1001240 RepID=A0A7W9E4K7_9MICO|nr:asparagine synthase (glutamine-hydrolyzing) [Cryobacterium roopkundense]MBB5642772.1 asparagine synthase (glutamine-hydrolyzing) [Cryobacterium roopkundense]
MCGIAGIQRFDGAPVDSGVLGAMARTLAHRGPDGHGFWQVGPTGFAHTRLSIIDLSGSSQPMRSVDARWVLTFNGEIFNYRQLRAGLSYPFRTDGDTEVILAGVSQHGIGWIDKLVGQFAFALHDTVTGTTHLVRDRLGVLPLYYTRTAEQLLFASEIKALLAALPTAPGVDLLSLDAYLAARSVPSPSTLFEGVSKLPPAHRAELTSTGTLTIIRYWQPPEADPRGMWTDAAAIDAVDAAVTEAVDSALVADVPVGAYLSGGVDSSLIVAKIAALRPEHRVQTFAAGFGDARTDELPWARRVSEHVGTDHHEVQVDSSDFESLWPRLTWHRDAPISEPADIAVYRLAQAAGESVRVILSGEGGDELFAGYPKYRAARAVAASALLPAGLRSKVVDSLERRMPARLSRARIALRAAGAATREEQYRTWFAPFTQPERTGMLGTLPARPARATGGTGTDVIRNMLLGDLDGWLPDNLLERGDRMSMAASLELRPPLLDHRLVELAFRLPSSLKVRNGTTKWVLKEVARRYLPAEVVDRRKVGFRVPLDQWFRSGLRDSMWDRLTGTDSFVANTFDRKAVRDLLERHESGRFSEENRIWTLMCLEVWHETFFGARTSPTPELETHVGIDQ